MIGKKFVKEWVSSSKAVCKSKHGSVSSTLLPQTAKEKFGRYSAHVAGLINICRRSRTVAFSPPPIPFNDDAGNHEKEDCTQGASQSDENYQTQGRVFTLTKISSG